MTANKAWKSLTLSVVIGLEELDNLVDLDLTDNLLGQHSSLRPFHNLHHLSLVSMSVRHASCSKIISVCSHKCMWGWDLFTLMM